MSTPTAISAPRSAAPSDPARGPAKSFVAHAKLIGRLTLVSRITGLAREVVAGHYLGTGLVASAFTVAFTIPNLFRKLFGEGALSAAFIPLYAQALKSDAKHAQEGGPSQPHGSANDFAVASVNLLCVLLFALTFVGEAILFAWMLLDSGMRPDRLLMFRLTAIMLPYVLLICGTAFLGAILQVHRRFGAPAAAPILLNVCHIVVVFVGARILHLRHGTDPNLVVMLQTRLAYWLAFFVLVAGLLQMSVLLPGLRAVGFRFKPVLHFWTPAIRKMLRLTVPVAMGAGVLQLSVLLDKAISVALMAGPGRGGHWIDHFAFFGHVIRFPMEQGAPARLNLAQFLYQFPLGIFAIALATAIFPGLSSDAMEKDQGRFKSVLRDGIEATLWESIPASIGLILVRVPAVRLLFQHGLISAHDADLISRSVLYYSAAIWAFSLLQILNRAYFAMHDTRTPLVMSVLNIVLNLVVEIPLLWWLGEPAMAVGTLVSFAIQTLLTLWLLDRRVGGLELRRIAAPIFKMCCAAGVMWAACELVQHSPGYPHAATRAAWLAQLMVIMVVGAGVYLGICAALGVDTMRQIFPRKSRV